jgi:uncharacterized protein (TIGR00369 family)
MDVNERFIKNHEYLRDMGIGVEQEEEGHVVISLPYSESLGNPGSGALQGGVVATLIDHAGAAALRTTLNDPLETRHATTDLNITYLRPATDDLLAEATVLRSGGSMGCSEVRVTSGTAEKKKVVAAGRASFYITRT